MNKTAARTRPAGNRFRIFESGEEKKCFIDVSITVQPPLKHEMYSRSPLPVNCNRQRLYHNHKKYPMVKLYVLIVGKESRLPDFIGE